MIKICEYCGKEFEAKNSRTRYCSGPHYMTCPICGKEYEVKDTYKLDKPPTTCSQKCKVKKIKQTSIAKYGCIAPGNNPEARKKAKSTMIKKYGGEYTMTSPILSAKVQETLYNNYGVTNIRNIPGTDDKIQSTCMERYGAKSYIESEEGMNKTKQTVRERYGTDYTFQSKQIQEKGHKTCLKKFGNRTFAGSDAHKEIMENIKNTRYNGIWPMQTEKAREKRRQTCIAKYGVDNPSKSPIILNKIKNTMIEKYGYVGTMSIEEIRNKIITTNMNLYGVPFYVMLPGVAKSSGKISNVNKHFAKKLDNIGILYELEYIIDKKSYDFYIPKYRLVIEIDPAYTHNIFGNHWGSKIDINYHILKSNLAEDKGIRCIHVFDYDNAHAILASLKPNKNIKHKDSTYMLPNEDIDAFLYKYGISTLLDYNFCIVETDTTDRVYRIIYIKYDESDNCFIVSNIVSIPNYVSDKPFKDTLTEFMKKFNISDIYLILDASKYTGKGYEELGFTKIKRTDPEIIWCKGREAISNTILHKNIPNLGDEELFDIMIHKQYLPVPNCGLYEFLYSIKV